MQKRGISIALPLINQADFGFVADEKTNRIIYSLKAINGIGDDVVRLIIENRPYTSIKDFYQRMIETKLVKTSQMIQLIKSGCFVELDNPDRAITMKNFIQRYVICSATKLTLQQFNRLIQFDTTYHFIPQSVKMAIRHKFFKDYVLDESFWHSNIIDENSKRKLPKKGYNDRWFKLDSESMSFFQQFYTEQSVTAVEGEYFVISEKKLTKENEKLIQPLKDWMTQDNALKTYNWCLFQEAWNKYAAGTISKWEMDSLSIYNEPHELISIDNYQYGIVDFFTESEKPLVYDYYTRTVKQFVDGEEHKVAKKFPKYRIIRLAGTVLDKNKDKHMVTLLTTTGVVTAKFNKGAFLYYDKQISQVNVDGTKTTIEKSWFSRGNKILICGYRDENQFRVYKYSDTIYRHTCQLITDVLDDGRIIALTERKMMNEE